MGRVRLGLLAALVVMALLAAQAPARLVSHLAPGGSLQLEGVEGTLWRGKAARATLPAAGGYLHLGVLRWRLSPWSLLTLSPRVTFDSQWGSQHLSTELVYHGDGRIRLANVDATLPAALVRQLVPLELRGDLTLLAQHLEIRDGMPWSGEGSLVWRGGGWVAPEGPRPLGDYAVEFRQPPGEALAGEVITLGGNLRAEGRVTLSGSDYDVDILLTGTGLDDGQLRQALQLVAAPEGTGFRLSLQGSMN